MAAQAHYNKTYTTTTSGSFSFDAYSKQYCAVIAKIEQDVSGGLRLKPLDIVEEEKQIVFYFDPENLVLEDKNDG